MGAISGGLEIIWDKKQFLLHPPSNLNYDWSLTAAFAPQQVSSKHTIKKMQREDKTSLLAAQAFKPDRVS